MKKSVFSITALTLALLTLMPASLFAWGRDGHAIVGLIAEAHLTPEAKAAVAELLEPGESLATVASWADEVRPDRDHTRPWHYANWTLTSPTPTYDLLTEQPEGNVVWAVQANAERAFNPAEPKLNRQEALKFAVHFVGDMHQPLHLGMEADRGANSVYVSWEGESSNLHRTWDSSVIRQTQRGPTEYSELLMDRITTETIQNAQAGGLIDWAIESRRLAVRHAYGNLPENVVRELDGKFPGEFTGVAGAFYEPGEADMVETFYINRGEIKTAIQPEVSKVYAERALPVIERQLLHGGLRLAKILNEGFATQGVRPGSDAMSSAKP
ncbi:MAG: S1/P1 nuclease [Sumerlaeia bacterium]